MLALTQSDSELNREEGACDRGVYHFTFSFKEVGLWQLHPQDFLKLFYHADFPAGWGEVSLVGLALWAIWMVGDLITACDVLYHS